MIQSQTIARLVDVSFGKGIFLLERKLDNKKIFYQLQKAKKPARKPATPKSPPQKKNSKGRPKRAAPPASKKKRKDVTSDEDDAEEEIESEDDEPLKKPPAKKGTSTDGAPTDDDIKKLLKDILKEANLEEITMKTVCKKVYANYPNHDLSQRKDFIKQTVKSVSCRVAGAGCVRD